MDAHTGGVSEVVDIPAGWTESAARWSADLELMRSPEIEYDGVRSGRAIDHPLEPGILLDADLLSAGEAVDDVTGGTGMV